MKDGLPSKTAALVAAYRGLAALLPDRRLASLAPDPYALQLAGWPYTWVFALARLPLLRRLLLSRYSIGGAAPASWPPAPGSWTTSCGTP